MPGRLAAALAVGGAFAFVVHRLRLLTRTASLLAGGLAASIIGLGGWAWAVPALLFFGSSTALSRWPGAVHEVHPKKTSSPADREARQVLANGGVAWALLVAAPLTDAALCYWGFVGAFAAAAADTWGTEIGSRSGRLPYSLRTLQRVERGTSGAISGAGTLATLAGAFVVVAGTAPFAYGFLPGQKSVLAVMVVVTTAGVAGAFADSLAGAYGQVRYREAGSDRLTERSTVPGQPPARGWPWLTNEGVNVVCTAVGAAGAMAGVALL